MRVRPVGARAALVEVPPGSGARWRQALLDLVAGGALPTPDEIVPGHRSVLVDGIAAAAVASALANVIPPDPSIPSDAVVEIPVVYDGADLAEVAQRWDTDVATVIKRHVASDFTVEFCGFAPGFPYLVGMEQDVPRRATPRTRVPAGAVALAGRFCGIYPTASPGGWQLIGRTGVRLFDVDRDPPALLPPGTRVRFRAVADQPPVASRTHLATTGGPGGSLSVVRAGALTTVQDLGRRGSAHLGVPRSGALDAPAARLANGLVGNEPDAAVLETTLTGVAFRVDRATTVAVTGAVAPVRLDGLAVEWGVAVTAPAGSVVDVGTAISGVRSYVAVAGGLQVAPVLGSRSTDTLSGLGPPALSAGQVLDLGDPRAATLWSRHAGVSRPEGRSSERAGGDVTLRLQLGPDSDWFAPGGVERLTGSTYTVSAASNRVGARLQGPPVAWRAESEKDSAGMVLGAVQVPPDGQPIVFLADHPTTGGYPVIGVVDPLDLAALAQARPGTAVHLRRNGA